MTVIQFPSEPRDGLLTRHEERAYAWCARNPILGYSAVPGTLETGERYMVIEDSRGMPVLSVCRERGEVAIIDCDPVPDPDADPYADPVPGSLAGAIPAGVCPSADSLREALTRDG